MGTLIGITFFLTNGGSETRLGNFLSYIALYIHTRWRMLNKIWLQRNLFDATEVQQMVLPRRERRFLLNTKGLLTPVARILKDTTLSLRGTANLS